MNVLGTDRVKRYVRWVSRADLGFDRHFALWSHVQVYFIVLLLHINTHAEQT